MRWMWTDSVGHEILAMLAIESEDIRVPTWTLNVGRETRRLRVNDDPPGCTASKNSPGDFIAEALLRRLSIDYGKEICFDKAPNQSMML